MVSPTLCDEDEFQIPEQVKIRNSSENSSRVELSKRKFNLKMLILFDFGFDFNYNLQNESRN